MATRSPTSPRSIGLSSFRRRIPRIRSSRSSGLRSDPDELPAAAPRRRSKGGRSARPCARILRPPARRPAATLPGHSLRRPRRWRAEAAWIAYPAQSSTPMASRISRTSPATRSIKTATDHPVLRCRAAISGWSMAHEDRAGDTQLRQNRRSTAGNRPRGAIWAVGWASRLPERPLPRARRSSRPPSRCRPK
jgi:hypothetical protein